MFAGTPREAFFHRMFLLCQLRIIVAVFAANVFLTWASLSDIFRRSIEHATIPLWRCCWPAPVFVDIIVSCFCVLFFPTLFGSGMPRRAALTGKVPIINSPRRDLGRVVWGWTPVGISSLLVRSFVMGVFGFSFGCIVVGVLHAALPKPHLIPMELFVFVKSGGAACLASAAFPATYLAALCPGNDALLFRRLAPGGADSLDYAAMGSLNGDMDDVLARLNTTASAASDSRD